MCSWGPIVLGHQNEAVNRAAYGQIEQGDCLNGPTRHAVELAELLVETIPHAAWALFQKKKNGTDATTACVTIARAATGRRKIVVAKGAYHGAVPWCSPSLSGGYAGRPGAHSSNLPSNNITSLREAVDRGRIEIWPGFLVSSFRHDISRTLEMPDARISAGLAAPPICAMQLTRCSFLTTCAPAFGCILALAGKSMVFSLTSAPGAKRLRMAGQLAAVTGGESVPRRPRPRVSLSRDPSGMQALRWWPPIEDHQTTSCA